MGEALRDKGGRSEVWTMSNTQADRGRAGRDNLQASLWTMSNSLDVGHGCALVDYE